jgi:hypothetical protein
MPETGSTGRRIEPDTSDAEPAPRRFEYEQEQNMNRAPRRINLPALGMATAFALAITAGVPAALQRGASSDALLPTLAAAPHTDPSVMEVSIQPGRIDVVAVRERNVVSRWLSFASHKRAG